MTLDEQGQRVLDLATQRYLDSGDFNGLPLRDIRLTLGIAEDEIRTLLYDLIQDRSINLNFGDLHSNSYIMALAPDPIDEQLQKLAANNLAHVCVYPTVEHLTRTVDRREYNGRPFTLMLALGEPQLAYRAFDLAVLEFYRNDPRYYYSCDDITGSISVDDEYFETGELKASDETLLQSFGFAYDDQLNRSVAVFLRYLSVLSPEHQQIWHAKLLDGDYRPHGAYYRSMVLGDWYEGMSICDAVLEEQHHINEMCRRIGRQPLFRKTFKGTAKPRSFTFLIRPTAAEYQHFVLLLDKMISDNINRDFFRSDIEWEYDETRSDGKVVVKQKGTLQALEEWLGRWYRTTDTESLNDMMKAFKKVRKERQRPAHSIDNDVFDHNYVRQQRQLLIDVYNGLHVLRLVFWSHPRSRDYDIPEPLRSGRNIWTH